MQEIFEGTATLPKRKIGGAEFIANMSPEQRQAALEKARQSKAAKAAHREANKHLLKLDYLDAGHWASLASKFGIRMPSSEEAVDTSCIRKYLKRAGIDVAVFNDHYTSMGFFVKNNPLWTKYAAAGLILELKENK